MKSSCESCGANTRGPADTLCRKCWQLVPLDAKKEYLRVWRGVLYGKMPARSMQEATRFLAASARGEETSLAHVVEQAPTVAVAPRRFSQPITTLGLMHSLRAVIDTLIDQRNKITTAIDALTALVGVAPVAPIVAPPKQPVALPVGRRKNKPNAEKKARATSASGVEIGNAILAFLRTNEGPQEMKAICSGVTEHGIAEELPYMQAYNRIATLIARGHVVKVGSSYELAPVEGAEPDADEDAA